MISQAHTLRNQNKKFTIVRETADGLASECTHFLQEEAPWVHTGVSYIPSILSNTPSAPDGQAVVQSHQKVIGENTQGLMEPFLKNDCGEK